MHRHPTQTPLNLRPSLSGNDLIYTHFSFHGWNFNWGSKNVRIKKFKNSNPPRKYEVMTSLKQASKIFSLIHFSYLHRQSSLHHWMKHSGSTIGDGKVGFSVKRDFLYISWLIWSLPLQMRAAENRRLLPDVANAVHILDGPASRYYLGFVDIFTKYGFWQKLGQTLKTVR